MSRPSSTVRIAEVESAARYTSICRTVGRTKTVYSSAELRASAWGVKDTREGSGAQTYALVASVRG